MARHDYQEIEVLRDPDGVVAVITKRGDTEYLSFSFQKEFERDAKIVRTSFLNRRHVAAVKRLLAQVEEFLDREADRASARAAMARRVEK